MLDITLKWMLEKYLILKFKNQFNHDYNTRTATMHLVDNKP